MTDHPLKTGRPRQMDWTEAGETLERLLAARNLSSQALADRAGVDRKTVDRLRRGEPVRLRTLAWIETALGASLRAEPSLREEEEAHPDAAPVRLGAYVRAHYRAYEGWWWGFRRSFDYRGRVICHSLRIHWDPAQNCLAFEERQRNRDGARKRDYDFRGVVSIPAGLGVLYFMIVGEGAVRVSAATLLRENAGESYMKGVMLALGEMSEVGFYPVVTPLYLVKAAREPGPADLEARLGSFEADRIWRSDVVEALADVEARFCRFGG
ncbi:helix-turn-helix transcriptional regulator [Neomegalonema sp.]|uniref:helix-turn-helix domain-containing protein n=1 Tax=Neomegalonema sp. TaxID=2039713 RepID=UPI0026018529|nr:helix-turn-helix transcriptional regulator [Neomegalonema sp.]MDD2868907.1 helix-turn-helix transcriptional regulator [Neomegalonema sp.]